MYFAGPFISLIYSSITVKKAWEHLRDNLASESLFILSCVARYILPVDHTSQER